MTTEQGNHGGGVRTPPGQTAQEQEPQEFKPDEPQADAILTANRTWPAYGLAIGEAIIALKQGHRVTRQGWNAAGMYLWLMPATRVQADWCREPRLKALAEENGGSIECLGSIRMYTADKKVLTGWLASQSDLLMEDWIDLGP